MNDKDGDPWGFATQAVAGLGLLILLAVITGSAFGATPGSYADWLAAYSTLAAVGAAMAAAWYASRAYAGEVQREIERDQMSRREQANLVATWPVRATVVPDFGISAALAAREIVQITAMVRNASQVPITSVELVMQIKNYSDDSLRISTPLATIVIPLVPPGPEAETVTKTLPEPVPLAQFGIQDFDELQTRIRVAITFRDAGNRCWVRDSEGSLRELVESAGSALKNP